MRDVVWIVLLNACITAMVPAKSRGIHSAITWMAGLSVLVVLSTPIARAADSIRAFPERFMALLLPSTETIDEAEIQSDKWVIRYGVRNIERGVQSLVVSRFSLEKTDVYVEVQTGLTGDGEVSVDRIKVYLLNDAVCDEMEAARYLSDLLGCPCEILRRKS